MARTNPNSTGTPGLTSVEHDATLVGSGTVLDPLGLAPLNVDGITVIGDGIDNPLRAITNQTGKYLISGGIAWSGTGYVYDVSSLNYVFDGVFYTASPTQVTMAAADPTNNRFDAVVVDIAGAVTVITGSASANPEFPTIPDDQLVVGYVLVEAGTTSPTILTDNIYLDNAEWTTTTYTTGSGSLGSIDFNSTDAPKQGSKCAKATATNLRFGMKFTRGTAVDLQTFASFQIWARLTATVATNKNLNVRFDNSLGNPVGNTVNLFNYGMSRTITGTWQLVQVPVSAFGAITNIKGVRAIMEGGVISNTATWSLDFMLLSGGILPQGALGPIYLSPSNTLYSEGAALGATAVTDSIFFGSLAGFQATAADGSIFLGKGSGYQATVAANSVFIGKNSGYGATAATSSNFIGTNAGYGAFGAHNSNFIGQGAGNLASNADNSVFIGFGSGNTASSAYSSIFIGTEAGSGGLNAYQSVFIGRNAGFGASNASNSFFLGYTAGEGASAATNSSFLGAEAGYNATNAASSVFLGYQAGSGATDAFASIFIGSGAGLNDTTTQGAIAIGYQSGSGGFNQSIALGTGTANTANNQMVIGSTLFPINDIQWQGILTSSDMHNNALAQGSATAQQVRSGTYTPTLTGVTNVTSATSRKATWSRVGNMVTVTGQFSVTPTANNLETKVGFSIPVASNFGTVYEAGGVASTFGTGVTEHSGGFYADTTNDRVELDFFETHGGTNTFSYTFSYEVL